LVTTLGPKPEKGRALLLWDEPMCFTSCKRKKKTNNQSDVSIQAFCM